MTQQESTTIYTTGHQHSSIPVDHGTEFLSRVLEDRGYQRGVTLDFTRPGKPTDNRYIESFNGRLRDECLNVHQITNLAAAQQRVEAWRVAGNEARSHGSFGHLPPGNAPFNVGPPRVAKRRNSTRRLLTNGTNVRQRLHPRLDLPPFGWPRPWASRRGMGGGGHSEKIG
jgi:hypothetical protein